MTTILNTNDNIESKIEHENLSNLNIDDIDISYDKGEVFGERLSLSSFYIFGNIKTYESQFINHKFNKFLFSNMHVFFIILFFALIYTVIFSFISPNPLLPSISEQILYNTIGVLLLVSFISYVFYIRKKPNIIFANIYHLVSDNITFFTNKQNRFDFIQYVQKNKSDFQLSDNMDIFKINLKNLKNSDKNNDVLNFTLISLFLHNIDIPNFYLKTHSEYYFDVSKDSNISTLFSYLDKKTQELIHDKKKESELSNEQVN